MTENSPEVTETADNPAETDANTQYTEYEVQEGDDLREVFAADYDIVYSDFAVTADARRIAYEFGYRVRVLDKAAGNWEATKDGRVVDSDGV